jgi:PHD/YefM family antitoxin component YafN of YafNO toxin-antitoxin module
MGITTLSSREFNQDVSRAKRAARGGPVFITERGKFEHVLLTHEDYTRLLGKEPSLAELLASPETAHIADEDWLPPRSKEISNRVVDLS